MLAHIVIGDPLPDGRLPFRFVSREGPERSEVLTLGQIPARVKRLVALAMAEKDDGKKV